MYHVSQHFRIAYDKPVFCQLVLSVRESSFPLAKSDFQFFGIEWD